MNETTNILVDSATRLFGEKCTSRVVQDAAAGKWPAELWSALEDTGLTAATVSADRGGAGSSFEDALTIVRLAGKFALPLPLSETLLGAWMLSESGLDVPAGPISIAPVFHGERPDLRDEGGWRISGTFECVPWAGDAAHVAVLCEADGRRYVASVPRNNYDVEAGRSLAGEPRDRVVMKDILLGSGFVAPAGPGVDITSFWNRGALMRLVAMEGALDRILQMTVEYCKTRNQFGRPIGKFQAVQQQIAVLAGNVAAASAASAAAIGAAANGTATFEIAAAKARICEAATVVSSIAHQLHGAIGFSQEYDLHLLTRRLWSWRDEFGDETQWWAWLGERVTEIGGDGLWSLLTAEDRGSALRS
jgi:acyl-CoA dehydrogenase